MSRRRAFASDRDGPKLILELTRFRGVCLAGRQGGEDAENTSAGGGGGLAAGLALLARDRGEVQVAFQLLIYPMIDDRNVTPASYAITDPRMWNRESNRLGWKAYLGKVATEAARATDLKDLPPAYIPVGALDLFVDENVEYAQRLIQAGVPTEFHVYPGAFHRFDLLAPSATVSKQFKSDADNALKRALHDTAR